jgi:transposase InsO family protein
MRRAGISGLPLRRRAKRVPAQKTVTDLVKRQFTAGGPNRLWVTGITGLPTREGKVCCCVVIDVLSRRVVGWAIDTAQRSDLATNALEGFRNRRRRHSALGWASPLEFETEHRNRATTPHEPLRETGA